VYVSQRPVNTLDVTITHTILRVRAVKNRGVLELEGANGSVVRVRVELCVPCHIPHLVTDAVGVPADLACEVCDSPSMADPMFFVIVATLDITNIASHRRWRMRQLANGVSVNDVLRRGHDLVIRINSH